MRIADEAIGKLAHMNQAAVVQADIDKRSKIDHVQYRAGQFHARLKILEL